MRDLEVRTNTGCVVWGGVVGGWNVEEGGFESGSFTIQGGVDVVDLHSVGTEVSLDVWGYFCTEKALWSKSPEASLVW